MAPILNGQTAQVTVLPVEPITQNMPVHGVQALIPIRGIEITHLDVQ